jgi:hypothetical protein
VGLLQNAEWIYVRRIFDAVIVLCFLTFSLGFLAPAPAAQKGVQWHLRQRHEFLGSMDLDVSANRMMIHFLDSDTGLLADGEANTVAYFNTDSRRLYSGKLDTFTLPMSRMQLMAAPDLQFDAKKWKKAGTKQQESVGNVDLFEYSYRYRAGAGERDRGYLGVAGREQSDTTTLALTSKVNCCPQLVKLLCRLYGLPQFGEFPVYAKLKSAKTVRLRTMQFAEIKCQNKEMRVPNGLTVCKSIEEAASAPGSAGAEELFKQ